MSPDPKWFQLVYAPGVAGPTEIARHVIVCHLTQHMRVQSAWDDVAMS